MKYADLGRIMVDSKRRWMCKINHHEDQKIDEIKAMQSR